MHRTRQFSQNLDLFYCCFETISPALRFYIRLLISLTTARYEIILVWEVFTSQKNVITSQNIPQNLWTNSCCPPNRIFIHCLGCTCRLFFKEKYSLTPCCKSLLIPRNRNEQITGHTTRLITGQITRQITREIINNTVFLSTLVTSYQVAITFSRKAIFSCQYDNSIYSLKRN